MATAVLSARRDAGGGLLLVSLDVAPELSRAYARPGQYVEVKVERGNGYFVLAGDVGRSPWELLVRNAGDAADALVTASFGAPIEISSPLGDGFPTAPPERVLTVVVVGSAFAVARPVVRQRISAGAARRTHVYIGVRNVADVPLGDEIATWASAGVRVVLCLSRDATAADAAAVALASLPRARGYVQQVVDDALAGGRIPPDGLVVAAGPEAMLADMRALGGARGVEVVTNV